MNADRFPGSDCKFSRNGSKRTPAPLAEGGIYSDATLTVLNSKNIAKTEIRFKNVYPTVFRIIVLRYQGK